MAENLDALALRSREVAHVFHNAEDGHVYLLKHGHTFSDHAKRSLLRRGHNHPAVQWDSLAQGKLSVAGAWRQIHQQKIQLPPIHSADELLDGFHDHGATPNHGLITFE